MFGEGLTKISRNHSQCAWHVFHTALFMVMTQGPPAHSAITHIGASVTTGYHMLGIHLCNQIVDKGRVNHNRGIDVQGAEAIKQVIFHPSTTYHDIRGSLRWFWLLIFSHMCLHTQHYSQFDK
jgi:hypothetical protein